MLLHDGRYWYGHKCAAYVCSAGAVSVHRKLSLHPAISSLRSSWGSGEHHNTVAMLPAHTLLALHFVFICESLSSASSITRTRCAVAPGCANARWFGDVNFRLILLLSVAVTRGLSDAAQHSANGAAQTGNRVFCSTNSFAFDQCVGK